MIELNGKLSLADFGAVVHDYQPVRLGEESLAKVRASRDFVERLVEQNEAVYGVNTGFGKFQNVRIDPDRLLELQRNLILSHAIGVGAPFDTQVVRGMLLLRAASLAHGYSGVRPQVIELLLQFLQHRVHPVVPSQGSVGASGDLAPLAHLAMALIGEGEVEYQGRIQPSAVVLAELGLEPLVLQAKEGLALINGTQAMGSQLALLVLDAQRLLSTVDIAAAMSVEALKGSHTPFDGAVTELRPHPGARSVSRNLGLLLQDSQINASHADCDKVQDAYSLRTVPQVHGAVRDALAHTAAVLAVELDAVTDNPLILAEQERVISAGNFHGEPLALAADYAGIALAELANISERRVEQMLNPALSGLPAFLASHGGLNSGLMISQYTAAALVSENKVLAHPASVDSIPTSANQEDHVSMGTHACRKARQILDNVLWVVSIELASAAQALDFNLPLRPGKGVEAVHKRIRQEVPHMDRDIYMKPDLERLRTMVQSGEIVRAAEAAVGSLD